MNHQPDDERRERPPGEDDGPNREPPPDAPPSRRLGARGRRAIVLLVLVSTALVGLWFAFRPPPDTTPEGAYIRVALNMGKGDLRTVFSYLEDPAQHAVYTIRDYRQKAYAEVLASYPEAERGDLIRRLEPMAKTKDAAEAWVLLVGERGWDHQLRRDTSGVVSVEQQGPRASVVTARGTRYAFRRRDNGMWGMTLFTAELLAEADRAARDWDLVQRAARDYASEHEPPPSAPVE